MVTIVLSTVSVMTSIFVFRINDSTSPLPHCVRVIAFRYLARLVCVSVSRDREPPRSSTSSVSVAPDDASCGPSSATCSSVRLANHGGTATAGSASQPAVPDHGQTSSRHDCSCELKLQVDSVLCELRKVNNVSSWFVYLRNRLPVGGGCVYVLQMFFFVFFVFFPSAKI